MAPTATMDNGTERPRQPDLSKYPKLSREQAGHLRHFHNLVSQPDNDWHLMGSQEPLQEFLDAYRYQLATMAYAAGLAHYHRQPALRGVYKPLVRRAIRKMLLRTVWAYWFNTSMAGTATDPDLKELRTPWADPVARENIMYSGHLLMMVSLYAMLFDDDEFEAPGALQFVWDPLFFGMGPETFSYSAQTLQDAILREMEGNGWVGSCCEPNCVFVVCNQFPGCASRHMRNRGVLEKYRAAWDEKGLVGPDGLLPDFWMVRQNVTLPARDPAFTAWGCAFMNAWNSAFVRSHFDEQSLGYVTNTGGEVRLNQPSVAAEFRKLVKEHGASPTSRATLETARRNVKEAMRADPAEGKKGFPYTKPTFGRRAEGAARVRRREPWSYVGTRGLYYPRNDQRFDGELEWTHMDPFSGNAAIGYARLNVEDGQRIVWERPWTAEAVASRPYVDGVTLGDGVDFPRGDWDPASGLLVLTVRTWDGGAKAIRPVVKRLEPGPWDVFVGGELAVSRVLSAGEDIALDVQVGGADLDIVVVKRV
ncbi:uncharacterized protein LY79DRAFT_707471 [Colletotrichum navitas]|uniref:Linalool dehydratase/isomerase domain-containing protein n=1 Tax=Colletotrichum navitas TaxID=681940 RepID=A0AAD8UXE6_9PEZI|nr:uncharacterized protein LY79DRAFT_707471 [Colletotrichum navitas]KAK1572652.1 hypothetical protein LY79DRAFT_707471 [Colletotrichum navitas]